MKCREGGYETVKEEGREGELEEREKRQYQRGREGGIVNAVVKGGGRARKGGKLRKEWNGRRTGKLAR